MTNTVLTAVKAIHQANRDELDQIVEAVKLQRTFLAKQSARTFTGRGGRKVIGTVNKVNPKTIIVDSPTQGRWKVTASMLTSLEA
jgi:ABC-type oligopeptide transport system ATPase subunit